MKKFISNLFIHQYNFRNDNSLHSYQFSKIIKLSALQCVFGPFYFYFPMIIDPIKSPDSTTLKSLTSDWNVLIQQLKNNSKFKAELPPIVSQRKSSLENYKNAIKLHEVNSGHKKTLTQKILDLSRKRKLSTVNLNEEVIRHKRNPSQQLPILTQQERELLACKDLPQRQKPPQTKTQNKGNIKKIDLANAKSIINQFKLFKKQTYNSNSPSQQGRKSPLKDMIKEKRSKPKLVIEESSKVEEKSHSVTFEGRLTQMVKDQNQHNKKLSFQLSHDSKSLKYRYTKEEMEQRRQRDGIPSVIKRRRIRPSNERKSSLSRPIHVSVESHKLLKYPSDEQQHFKTPTNKNKTQLLKKEQKPTKESQKSVIPLKPMPQSHIKQKHYVPKKKISLRTISHNDNSPFLRYEPWDNPQQYMQTIYIQNCSFNMQ